MSIPEVASLGIVVIVMALNMKDLFQGKIWFSKIGHSFLSREYIPPSGLVISTVGLSTSILNDLEFAVSMLSTLSTDQYSIVYSPPSDTV